MNKKTLTIILYLFWILLTYLLLKENEGNSKISQFFAENFQINQLDKLAHIFFFSILAILFTLAYNLKWYVSLSILAFYGIIIEVLQYSLPINRSFEFFDWIADITGVLAGLLIIRTNILNKILQVKN